MALQPTPNDAILVDKPFLDTEEAADLFIRLYGMPKATSVKPLDGYDSQNFLLELGDRTDGGSAHGNINGPAISKYVLKIMSTEESKDQDGIRALHSVQKYLKQHDFMCAAPLNNIHGENMKLEEFTQEKSKEKQYLGKRVYGLFIVRAYPFIPGIPFRDVTPANATQLFYESGRMLARFHMILESYPDDVCHLKKKAETFEWSLSQIKVLTKYMDDVRDNKNRRLAMDVVEAFENQVLARRQKLRSGIVHSDFSHTNLVLSPVCTTHLHNGTKDQKSNAPEMKANYQLSGVIDFDDCHYNCLVFDIGISMMYLSLSKAAGDQPMHASGAFLAGYQSINALTPGELEVLHICQAARYVQSLVLGLHTYTLQPSNEYLLDTQNGWPVLEQLWKMEPSQIRKMWQDVAAECVQFEGQTSNH